MLCWYCWWGWPRPVADIFDAAVKELDGDDSPLRYGPGHIVWEDENFETGHIEWCLGLYSDEAAFSEMYYRDGRFSEHDMEVVRRSLEALLNVSEEVRCCEPEGYLGISPEKFPPPPGFEMVRR